MKFYDEKEALDFIKKQIAPLSISDSTICEIVDALYDYYDDNGLLDFDFDDENDIEDEDIDLDHIAHVIASDLDHPTDLIINIIKAENKYQDSLL